MWDKNSTNTQHDSSAACDWM